MANKIKSITRFSYTLGKLMFGEDAPEQGEEFKSNYILFDENGNSLETLKFNNDGEVEERNTCKYNSQGNVIEEETYYAEDDISEKVILTRDDKSLILEEKTIFGNGSLTITIYNRIEDKNLLEKITFDEDNVKEGREELYYNDKKLLTELKKYDEIDALKEHQTFLYDDKDNIVEVKMFGEDDKLIARKEIHFNEYGVEMETMEFNAKGDRTAKTISSYDENGNLVEKIFKDFHSKTLKLEYDEKNRCIQEDIYDENDTLIRRTTNEFDEEGNLIADTFFASDLSRGGRDEYTGNRYEYEFYE